MKGRGDIETIASRSVLTNNGDIRCGPIVTTREEVQSFWVTTMC